MICLPIFWALFGTFAICGFTTSGLVQVHLIPLCADFGMPELQAAGLLGVMGIFDLIGTSASGWLSDRHDCRRLLACYYAVRGLALLLLPVSSFTIGGLSAFAVLYGLDWIATVPPTLKLAVRAFGAERAPLVFGWVFTAHQIGAAAAAVGAGITHDMLLSYLPAFLSGGLLCLAAAVAVLLVRLPAETTGRPVRARQSVEVHCAT